MHIMKRLHKFQNCLPQTKCIFSRLPPPQILLKFLCVNTCICVSSSQLQWCKHTSLFASPTIQIVEFLAYLLLVDESTQNRNHVRPKTTSSVHCYILRTRAWCGWASLKSGLLMLKKSFKDMPPLGTDRTVVSIWYISGWVQRVLLIPWWYKTSVFPNFS